MIVPGRRAEIIGNRGDAGHDAIFFGFEGLSCGYSSGSSVVPTFQSPFTFAGTTHKVTVDLSGDLIVNVDHNNAYYEATAARILATV
jgi:hypothetical protein